jgi:nucleoside-triphosphatase THEP1
MDTRTDYKPSPSILAVVYTDGHAADRFLADLGYRLRDAGVAIAGIVQHNEFVRDRSKCDMVVEELDSGTVLQLSEDRGREARGCRLDRGALSEASALLAAALRNCPDLVILNKFGKTEAEGRGLRDVLSEAVQLGIPVIAGVPYRNIDQWRAFAGEFAEERTVGDPTISQWLARQGITQSAEIGDTKKDRVMGINQAE